MFTHFYNMTTEEAEVAARAWLKDNGVHGDNWTLQCLGTSPDGRGTWVLNTIENATSELHPDPVMDFWAANMPSVTLCPKCGRKAGTNLDCQTCENHALGITAS